MVPFWMMLLGLFENKVDSASGANWHKTLSRASKEAIDKVSATYLFLASDYTTILYSPNFWWSCS
jgi:hypothetical protein